MAMIGKVKRMYFREKKSAREIVRLTKEPAAQIRTRPKVKRLLRLASNKPETTGAEQMSRRPRRNHSPAFKA